MPKVDSLADYAVLGDIIIASLVLGVVGLLYLVGSLMSWFERWTIRRTAVNETDGEESNG